MGDGDASQQTMTTTNVLRRARGGQRITLLVGAGLSTAAGIPDVYDVCSPGAGQRECHDVTLFAVQTIEREPQRLYDVYRSALAHEPAAGFRPTAAHYTLAALDAQGRLCGVVAQNVDGLVERAGVAPERVHNLNGSLAEFRCANPRCPGRVPGEQYAAQARASPTVLACPVCDEYPLRPDVVLFGEQLDTAVTSAAAAALRDCDVFVCAGTSLNVAPAASIPLVNVPRDAVRVWIHERDPPPPAYASFFDLRLQRSCDDALAHLFGQHGTSSATR